MNGKVTNYGVEGAKYGISFGSALAIAISYTNNHHPRLLRLALCDLLCALQVRRA